MNSPRISILFWAIYELAIGAGLFLIPAQLADLLGITEPREVWVRVIGIAVIGLGILYLSATFTETRWFYRATVIERAAAAVMLAYLAVVDGPWQLWGFAIATLLGALWTLVAMRNAARAIEVASPPTTGLDAATDVTVDPG